MNNNNSSSRKNKKNSRRNFLKIAAVPVVAAPYIMLCGRGGNLKTRNKRIIKTGTAPEPVGPYSQAIKVGEFIFVSGQIPLNPKNNQLDKGDIKSQTKLVLENISGILKAAAFSMKDVVKTTVFMTDLDEFSEMNEIYSKYFSQVKPARSTVQVAGLAFGIKIEIDAIAVKDK